MLPGDAAVLEDLCSGDLIYTHSKADYDKRSYMHKVGTRHFTYLGDHASGRPVFWSSMAPRS